MAELKGFVPPLSPEGRSSVVPGPPWHYSGDLLTIEYRAAPGSVARWLPDPLEPAEEDPDAVAVIFADWQSCSDSFEELVDPVRSQYKEAFVVVRCRYRGETYSRCILIWVDKDFAMVRGLAPGLPEEARLDLDHASGPSRQGRPPPRARWAVRREREVHDRRVVDAGFTITGPAETNGFVNALPMLHPGTSRASRRVRRPRWTSS